MKDQENLYGIGESQVLERVERLERRIRGIMINPVINGGMDIKEKR